MTTILIVLGIALVMTGIVIGVIVLVGKIAADEEEAIFEEG